VLSVVGSGRVDAPTVVTRLDGRETVDAGMVIAGGRTEDEA
jgi:hypothetical protein